MAAESISPPPASGGGSAKYLIVLLLLIGGGLGIFLATRSAEPPPQAAAAPPPKNAERPTSLADNQLEIPVEEPDAGTAKVEPDQPKKSRGRGDSWSCQGDLPPQEIRAVLNDSSVQIRSCYERRLRVDNLLQGNVSMQVRIGADGKVQATRVRGNMRDSEVKTCMQNIAKKWTFPPPSGGNCAVFEAPYAFTPKQ